MIAIDAPVLIRFLTQDHAEQGALVRGLIGTLTPQDPVFVAREVLCEAVAILEQSYGLSRGEIARALDALLEAEEVVVEAVDRVGLALSRYRAGGPGFADQMIVLAGRDAGATTCYTFDPRTAEMVEATLLS